MAKLILNYPTLGANAGDEIDVRDKDTADALVASGTARRAPAVVKKAEPGSSS